MLSRSFTVNARSNAPTAPSPHPSISRPIPPQLPSPLRFPTRPPDLRAPPRGSRGAWLGALPGGVVRGLDCQQRAGHLSDRAHPQLERQNEISALGSRVPGFFPRAGVPIVRWLGDRAWSASSRARAPPGAQRRSCPAVEARARLLPKLRAGAGSPRGGAGVLIVVLFKSVYILSNLISHKNCPHKLCSSLTNQLIWIACSP